MISGSRTSKDAGTVGVGEGVGATSSFVGRAVGGELVGRRVGERVGGRVGYRVGIRVGERDGDREGCMLGDSLNCFLFLSSSLSFLFSPPPCAQTRPDDRKNPPKSRRLTISRRNTVLVVANICDGILMALVLLLQIKMHKNAHAVKYDRCIVLQRRMRLSESTAFVSSVFSRWNLLDVVLDYMASLLMVKG